MKQAVVWSWYLPPLIFRHLHSSVLLCLAAGAHPLAYEARRLYFTVLHHLATEEPRHEKNNLTLADDSSEVSGRSVFS